MKQLFILADCYEDERIIVKFQNRNYSIEASKQAVKDCSKSYQIIDLRDEVTNLINKYSEVV